MYRLIASCAFLLLVLTFLLITQPKPTSLIGTAPGSTPLGVPYAVQTTVSGSYLQPAANIVQ